MADTQNVLLVLMWKLLH